ncbi:7607_t:CDS:1, partial [Racocetra persica]
PNEDETIHEKGTFLTSSGKIVIMEINVVRLPNINKKEYPDDFKFSFMVLNEKDEQEYVRLDNHKNKPPH